MVSSKILENFLFLSQVHISWNFGKKHFATSDFKTKQLPGTKTPSNAIPFDNLWHQLNKHLGIVNLLSKFQTRFLKFRNQFNWCHIGHVTSPLNELNFHQFFQINHKLRQVNQSALKIVPNLNVFPSSTSADMRRRQQQPPRREREKSREVVDLTAPPPLQLEFSREHFSPSNSC